MLLKFTDWLVYDIFGLSSETKLGGAVNFFVYDSVKILLLLFVLIFVIGVIRTFLPQNKIKKWMGQRGIAGNFFAS
ncbi:MAG: permease, partial [Candidatus Omnitrophica bacterium]|nr:permease [Candidatus Omnitrophota bacterium]